MTNLFSRGGAIIIVLAVLSGLSRAQVPLRDYWGEETRAYNARMLATGGAAGLEPGPVSVFTSPALLGFARKPGIEGTWTLKVSSEERSRTVYDQFENALGDVAIADNIHGSGIPGPLAGVFRFGRLAAAAGIAPVRDFGYSYLKEYRDDFYIKTGEDRVEQAGILYDGTVGVAYSPFEWLSAGATGGYTFGSRSLETWAISGTDTIHALETGTPSGIGFSGGLGFRPVPRLLIGTAFASGHRLAKWQSGDSATAEASRDYPWSAQASVSYRAPGTLPSVVGVEARYAAWHGVDTTYSNTLVLRAGVEHTMLNFVRLRYGFGVEPQPFEPTVQTADISFGLGFDVGVAQIDVGAMMARDLIGPGDFSTPLAESDVKVHESRSYFSLSVSREF